MITKRELVPLEKKVSVLAQEVDSLVINDEKSMKEAVVILSNINKYGDSVKEKKESLTKPLNETLRNIRAMFKPLEDVYEGAIASLRAKMSTYQTEQVRLQREAEAKIAARVGEGKGKLKIETAVKKISEVEVAQKEVATGAGLVQFREVKKFRIIEITKVPLEYMMVDEKKVNQAIKEGKEIAGIEVYTEQIAVNYR